MKPKFEMKVEVMESAEGVFLAICQATDFSFAGQVIFEFRLCCGHLALKEEYFLPLIPAKLATRRSDIQDVVGPERLTLTELNALRVVAADGVLEFAERYQSTTVIDPSDTVKQAMKNLIRITEAGPEGMGSQIPKHLRGFMVERCDEMLGMLRAALNAYTANEIAGTVMETLDHYDLVKEDACVQSYLN